MRETFTSGSGGAPGNRCFYPEIQTFFLNGVSLRSSLLSEAPPPSCQTYRLLCDYVLTELLAYLYRVSNQPFSLF
jgi:hypothetical protein